MSPTAAQPLNRTAVYNSMVGTDPDTVLLIEDHVLCEDGEDQGEPML
ncbi:hypothetical protein [Streptomyces sp. SGAir0957]